MIADGATRPLKVLHVITGLDAGGAQFMLYRLLREFRGGDIENEVVCLAGEAPLASAIRDLGISVRCLDLPDGPSAMQALGRLGGLIRDASPDLVQCWMYHANLLGGLACWLYGHMPVLWNIRQSNLDPLLSKRSTILVANIGARLSSWLPRRIVCVSESARAAHRDIGYMDERMVVIENGFDFSQFSPDEEARRSLRAELGLPPDALVIGLAARFDAQKDVGTFLAAAARVLRVYPQAHFILCGDGMSRENAVLNSLIADLGLDTAVHLLGRRTDIARVTAAFDIATSSSVFGEGFSNSLGEALCCGVPAVATDVGDARRIVDSAGRIVPPGDPDRFAAAIAEIVELGPDGRRRLGELGRAYMERHFTIAAIAERYVALYRNVGAAFAEGGPP